MSDLKARLIRLGNAKPELRPHLKPVIASLASDTRIAYGDPMERLELIPDALKDIASAIYRAQVTIARATTDRARDQGIRSLNEEYANLSSEMRGLKSVLTSI